MESISNNINNPYDEQLIDLIGFKVDITEKELMDQYGITYEEYLHPTEEIINKVMDAIQTKIEKGKKQ